MNTSRKNNFLIFAIIICAVFLRVWGLGYGLPEILHQDEPIVINHALAYGVGDLNPHFFIIPPLCSYLLFFCYGIFFVIGKIAGIFSGSMDFAVEFFRNPTSFYLIARSVLGVIPGVLSVWLVYRLYQDLFSEEGAEFAALIYAVSFVNVVNSHYAYLDSMMVFCILAVYISLVRLMRNACISNYIVSGCLFGIAVGVKYNSAILIVPCFLAHGISVRFRGGGFKEIVTSRCLYVAMFASLVAFVISNPFSVLDWQHFSKTIFGGIRSDYMGWMYHIRYSLFQGMGTILSIVGIVGCILIVLREEKAKKAFFVSFPFIFYLHLVFVSQRFSRYILPIVPFIAIGASFFIYSIILKDKGRLFRKNIVMILAILIVIPTFVKSIKADMLFSGKDTRVVSAEWIKDNIEEATGIAMDSTSLRPQVKQTIEQLNQKYYYTGKQEGLTGAKEKKLGFMIKALEGVKTYNVFFLLEKVEAAGQFLATLPALEYRMEDIRKENINYVVINTNTICSNKSGFIDDLLKNTEEIITFSPYSDGIIRYPYDDVDVTFMAIGKKELFARQMTGPCLIICKLKQAGSQTRLDND